MLEPAQAPVFRCVKAYDVRGRVPDELDGELAARLGRAYVEQFSPRAVVIGRDTRLSSVPLAAALSAGLRAAGAEVYDLGLCATEEVYFATFQLGLDGGVMVTASHNPPEYNGIKFVREGARPVGAETGLKDMARRVVTDDALPYRASGGDRRISVREAYAEHVRSYIDAGSLSPLRMVVNAGNGCAGPVFDAVAEGLPLRVTRLFHEPDGRFPHGVPNPLLPERRAETAAAVQETHADLGVAWDGDGDRCFLFDEQGQIVEGYYLVGLLAEAFLSTNPGAKIVHDPRLVWNTQDIVLRDGGVPVLSRCGHAYMKDAMRAADAVYGGEMSGHHYFRRFAYCDSGMIPWLLAVELLSRTGTPLSRLIEERQRLFPVSGEINREVTDAVDAMRRVQSRFETAGGAVMHLDGLSMEFKDWRFNLRPSNTEPLLRLNVETRGDEALMRKRTGELVRLIEGA